METVRSLLVELDHRVPPRAPARDGRWPWIQERPAGGLRPDAKKKIDNSNPRTPYIAGDPSPMVSRLPKVENLSRVPEDTRVWTKYTFDVFSLFD